MSHNDPDQIKQTALLASIIGQVGCVTVIIIAIALIGGVFLDRMLETRAIFTILFLVGSVPVTLYIIVRLSLTALARTQNAQKEMTSEQTEEK